MTRKYSPAELEKVKNPGRGRGYRPMKYADCLMCRKPMRPPKALVADWPGTKRHAGRGLCSGCYSTDARYLITPEEFHQMLIAQSGRCAVCCDPMTGKREPCIDHDHATNQVRGLLCTRCNAAEGMLQGNPQRARALANYMEKHMKVVTTTEEFVAPAPGQTPVISKRTVVTVEQVEDENES